MNKVPFFLALASAEADLAMYTDPTAHLVDDIENSRILLVVDEDIAGYYPYALNA